jgi:hypothetical protein
MAMKKIYVTRERKWLDNGKDDSRYTLAYFVDEGVEAFIQARFPDVDVKDYSTLYGMTVDEVYDETNGFAVVQYDDAIQDETTFMTAITKLRNFMGITKRTKARASNSLSQRYTEVEPDKFEIHPEMTDEVD